MGIPAKKTVLLLSILVIVAVSITVLLLRAGDVGRLEEREPKTGKPFLFLAVEFPHYYECMGIDLDDIPEDDHFSLSSNSVDVTPVAVATEGQARIFSFSVADRGVKRRVERLVYSGEDAVTVMRGTNWFLQIRKD